MKTYKKDQSGKISTKAVFMVIMVIVILSVLHIGFSSNSSTGQKLIYSSQNSQKLTSSLVDTVINTAESHLNTGYDDGFCLAFVANAWDSVGVNIGGNFPSDDPVTYWENNYGGWTRVASYHQYNSPPKGALVFWGATRWSSSGHVAISLGNNQVVSTAAYPYLGNNPKNPDVFIFNLSDRSPATYNYLGYILPLNNNIVQSTQAQTQSTQAQTQSTQAQPVSSSSIQIQWSSSYPNWIAMKVTGFSAGNYSYTCNFASGSDTAYSVYIPNSATVGFDNGQTCMDSISGDSIWVTINSVSSNILTVPNQTLTQEPTPTATPTVPNNQNNSISPAPADTSALSQPVTYSETVGGNANTWTNYLNAGGNQGTTIAAYTTVQITCKIQGFTVVDGNSWWYLIASSPWNNAYYVSADAFYNDGATSGSLIGTPFVDNNVPNC